MNRLLGLSSKTNSMMYRSINRVVRTIQKTEGDKYNNKPKKETSKRHIAESKEIIGLSVKTKIAINKLDATKIQTITVNDTTVSKKQNLQIWKKIGLHRDSEGEAMPLQKIHCMTEKAIIDTDTYTEQETSLSDNETPYTYHT